MSVKYYIKSVEFKDTEREVWVHLSNGGCVHICACHESFEQYNGTVDELKVTVGIADIVNNWLHSEEDKPTWDIENEIVAIATDWIKDNDREVFSSIEDFEERREIAMSRIDRMRSPLRLVDVSLYDDMYNVLSEWCEDNGFDVDEFDVENMVF